MTIDEERVFFNDAVEVPAQEAVCINEHSIRIDPLGTVRILPTTDIGV